MENNDIEKFTTNISSSVLTHLVSNAEDAVAKLREVNTLLTEISRADADLSKSDLEKIGKSSFDISSRYGRSVTDYLSAVREASRAGYENAMGIAELSIAAQEAGGMTAELADRLILTTDKAYQMNGSITDLTAALDGMNYITNQHGVHMSELSEGMSAAGSVAASFGVDINETAAALGTMIAATRQGGTEAAEAFRAVLLNIRQVSAEEEGIDAESLAKYEQACLALNVRLREIKDGMLSLRDPMEVLGELSAEYNKLDASDRRRSDLLNSVGNTSTGMQLDALLRQWSTYETMLQQYKDGAGSMAREAAKTADSWEGSLNRLSNTWTDTVGNVAESGAVITLMNSLNGVLSVVNHVTDALGSLGTIGLGAGIFYGLKNKSGGLIRLIYLINNSPFLATVEFNSDVYDSYVYT